MLKIDGRDNAIVGVIERAGQETILCYDKHTIIENLMVDMSEEDALEYYNFNILGAWMGELTPCFLTLQEEIELTKEKEWLRCKYCSEGVMEQGAFTLGLDTFCNVMCMNNFLEDEE